MQLVIAWMLIGGFSACLLLLIAASAGKIVLRDRARRRLQAWQDRRALRDKRNALRQAIEERMAHKEGTSYHPAGNGQVPSHVPALPSGVIPPESTGLLTPNLPPAYVEGFLDGQQGHELRAVWATVQEVMDYRNGYSIGQYQANQKGIKPTIKGGAK